MAKTLELAFVMAGKIAPEFMAATKAATTQLAMVEKKTKDIQTAADRRNSVASWKNLTKSAKGFKSALVGVKGEIVGVGKAMAGLIAGNGLLGAMASPNHRPLP